MVGVVGVVDGGAGLDFRGCLHGAGVGVAAAETGHEGWLCGACLDHVISSGMHFECFIWIVFG